MNVNEYGVQFVLGASFNLSAFSTLSITFTKPDLTTLTVASPNVTISASALATPLGTFGPNTYALYTFQSGDVNQAGLWSVRLTYTAPGPVQLISDITTFTVNP